MITGKIILKSATKVSLDKRFSDIAKQAPPAFQQQAHVIIPASRQELFGNRRPAALSIAQRLKKRSINNQLGRGPNINQPFFAPARPRVFQRLGFANRRRGGGGGGNNSYLFGGQSGLGVRLRGQGRVGGPRVFRSRTRGYLNNNAISRFKRGNRNNYRGRMNNNNNNNNNFNRGRGRQNFNRGRGRGSSRGRGRGRGRGRNNNTSANLSKEGLDTDLDKYMAQTKLENDSVDMNAV